MGKQHNEFHKGFWLKITAVLFVCAVIFVLVTNILFRRVHINGLSMYPTLKNNDDGFSNSIVMHMSEIERFDIVVAYAESVDKYVVKRVIGLPGEVISYKDDVLYIDGVAVEEPFLETEYAHRYQERHRFTRDFKPYQIPENSYYLMGDNRPFSTDSRVLGAFTDENILSKDIFILFPFENFGIIQ